MTDDDYFVLAIAWAPAVFFTLAFFFDATTPDAAELVVAGFVALFVTEIVLFHSRHFDLIKALWHGRKSNGPQDAD